MTAVAIMFESRKGKCPSSAVIIGLLEAFRMWVRYTAGGIHTTEERYLFRIRALENETVQLTCSESDNCS